MSEKPSRVNPYDFRAPVREPQLLAGREQEKEQVDSYLREGAAGRPVHFSLFGAPGSGKSSLLNIAHRIASDRRLLPIKLVLREAIVEAESAFYAAIFEAVLQALIDRGAITADGDLMRGWLHVTRTGAVETESALAPLEMSLTLAARVQGRIVGSVQIPSLMRDLDRLLALVPDVKGLAVCIDAAEHLDDNRDIAESLLALTDADRRIILVTAAQHAGRLQAAASRTWAQIEVAPFSTSQEVFEAMTKPLERLDTSGFNLKPATADDIRALTRGQPYEVNLVCHFIWEAIQEGAQQEFALSDTVIQRVLAEFIERGRHESSTDIPLVVALTARDYELLARLAPYEELTVREIALLRLMLRSYTDEQLSELEADIHNDLFVLSQRRILEVQDDRFRLTVSDDARLYMRYAAERHTGDRIGYGQTYMQHVAKTCRVEFGRALAGQDNHLPFLVAFWRGYEMGGPQSARLVAELRDAVASDDLDGIASHITAPMDLSAFVEHRAKGLILYSFVLRVGLQDIEHATFALNVDGLDGDDLALRATEWRADNRELLQRFDIEIVELRCELVDPKLADSLVAYTYVKSFQALAMSLYTARQIDPGQELLSSALGVAEALVASDPTDPILRAAMGDAKNRVGFMLTSLEKWTEALAAFEESERLSLEQQWVTSYNTAYINARTGALADAIASADVALATISQPDRDMLLHVDFPTLPGWEPRRPWFHVVSVSGIWSERLVRLQAGAWVAQSPGGSSERLEAALDEVGDAAPPAVLTLAAWAELSLRGNATRALELLELAVDSSDLHEVEFARAELAGLRDRLDGQGEPTDTPSGEGASSGSTTPRST